MPSERRSSRSVGRRGGNIVTKHGEALAYSPTSPYRPGSARSTQNPEPAPITARGTRAHIIRFPGRYR